MDLKAAQDADRYDAYQKKDTAKDEEIAHLRSALEAVLTVGIDDVESCHRYAVRVLVAALLMPAEGHARTLLPSRESRRPLRVRAVSRLLCFSLLAVALLAGCGPGFDPPPRPELTTAQSPGLNGTPQKTDGGYSQ